MHSTAFGASCRLQPEDPETQQVQELSCPDMWVCVLQLCRDIFSIQVIYIKSDWDVCACERLWKWVDHNTAGAHDLHLVGLRLLTGCISSDLHDIACGNGWRQPCWITYRLYLKQCTELTPWCKAQCNVPWLMACKCNVPWLMTRECNVPGLMACECNVPWLMACECNVPWPMACKCNVPWLMAMHHD